MKTREECRKRHKGLHHYGPPEYRTVYAIHEDKIINEELLTCRCCGKVSTAWTYLHAE